MLHYLFCCIDVSTLLVFVVVLCVVIAYQNARKPSNAPPGPPTKMFVGNADMFVHNIYLHKTLHKLQKQYGPIFSFQLGWYPSIVLSSPELIKEAFVKHADHFSDRALHIFLMKIVKSGDKGIINNNGESFKAAKRMAMTTLRDFGVGKPMNETKIIEEAEAIMTEIEKHKGKPFQFDILFGKASCNVICSMLFGQRYDYDDEKYIALLHDLQLIFKLGGLQQGYCTVLPYLLPLLFINKSAYKGFHLFTGIFNFINARIKEHRQTFDPDNIKDFVDIFLQAQQKYSGKDGTTSQADELGETFSFWNTQFNTMNAIEANIMFIILDLFIAGTESTSTTLLWGIAYMIRNPEVQEKCRKEIHSVVGQSKNVTVKDKFEMPYIEATLLEIQRISNIAPVAIMHCTNGSVELGGYVIPDKTIVIPNLYSVHMNADIWPDPEEFNPNRFLNDEGKVTKPEAFMPFSIGRRSCPGESLAKTELFLIFTTLIQKYQFTAPDVTKVPTIADGTTGVTLTPPLYDVIATKVEQE